MTFEDLFEWYDDNLLTARMPVKVYGVVFEKGRRIDADAHVLRDYQGKKAVGKMNDRGYFEIEDWE